MQEASSSLIAQTSDLEELVQKANDLINAARADSKRKAYRTDWRDFEFWSANTS